jgi:hypothetical protein
MVTVFTCLLFLQFSIILPHDLIDVRGWVHGSQVQALLGKRKVWLATVANSVVSRSCPPSGCGTSPTCVERPKSKRENMRACTQGLAMCCLHVATTPVQIYSMLASTPCSS